METMVDLHRRIESGAVRVMRFCFWSTLELFSRIHRTGLCPFDAVWRKLQLESGLLDGSQGDHGFPPHEGLDRLLSSKIWLGNIRDQWNSLLI